MIAHQNQKPVKPSRVLLLGARGFISTALSQALDREGTPTATIGSAQVDLAASGAQDLLQPMLRPDDAVVMLSALTPDKGRDIATLMKNLAMMQAVCAALERCGCDHFVYISSDAVYPVAQSLVSEQTPASPGDLYGAMHHTRELMARSLSKIPVLVLRPTLVYGVGDTHNSYGPNRFRRMASKDRKIVLFGQGEDTRDHVHVDDVAALIVRCLLHRSTGTLNIATGTSTSFKRVAELVAARTTPPAEVATAPAGSPVTHRHYDVTALISAFPDFSFIPLAEGIARVHAETAAQADG